MATKNNPGKFDCYANAHPDEPMFVLLARDKHAPALVEAWSNMRALDGESAEKIEEARKCAASMRRWQENSGRIPMAAGDISDGYHTFDELYEHRCLLFCMIAQVFAISNIKNWRTWKSWKHNDGSVMPGWFIAGLDIGNVITYHLPASMWEMFAGEELDVAPPWDGHTSQDVINRLTEWLKA